MVFKLNKFLILLVYFLASLYLPSEESLVVKNEYKPVVNEIIEILDQNHFKKNIVINEQKVIDNFLVNIDKEKIVFNDTRRFGSIHFTKSFKNHRLIENLGVEPLSREFNKDYLFEICRIKNISIKKLIMDQKVVVGVGNIYASESLFLAKIKPNRLSKKISLKECDQLTNAIKRITTGMIMM